jgi:hypothetical protein
VGGVRIFPVAPAPAPAKPQVKVLFLDFSIVVERLKKKKKKKLFPGAVCVFAFFYSFYLILFFKNFLPFLKFSV